MRALPVVASAARLIGGIPLPDRAPGTADGGDRLGIDAPA